MSTDSTSTDRNGVSVDIVMLGHSGAGKTTYLSLMYAEMQDGVGGFCVRAEAQDHHTQLLADARAIRDGSYPVATHQRASYDLTLTYDNEAVLPFTWRDHRGGAASGRTSDSDDVAQLHQDLASSDAIVVFVDGPELVSQSRGARTAGRLASHVLRSLEGREEILTPLVIGVTKCDLLDLDDEKVTDAIFTPFEELVDAVAATEHIHGTVLPLSCGPSSTNVVIPVLWSLRFGIIGMAMRLAAAHEKAQESANAAARRDTLGDRFGSWLFNEPSWASIADQHRMEARRAYRDFEALVAPAEQLDKVLEGISAF
jgi:hypothetical protein